MMHQRLKEYFVKCGLSQQEIAESLGVSPPYINAILNGKKPIGKKNAERLANLYGISKSFLLTGDGPVGNSYPSEDPEDHQPIITEDEPAPYLPTWADTLINILSKQIAENEALNRELHQSIQEVNTLLADLQNLLNQLK